MGKAKERFTMKGMKGMKKTGIRQRPRKPPRMSRISMNSLFVFIREIRGGVVACSVPVYPGRLFPNFPEVSGSPP